ncbi:MAG TPA: LuxR C-terminal-related transcriptional regulator, partial [Dehalococcoidia bacterium]
GGDYQGHSYCRQDCPTIRAVTHGKGPPAYDVKSRTKDGRDIWLNVSVIPAPDPEGDGHLAVHMFRDVSQRRKAELLAQQTIATVSEFSEGPGGTNGDSIIDSQPAPQPPLTRRELEVLRFLACGMRDANIAESLGIRPTTVRNHVEHILGKLGVHSRLEAVVFAAQHRLV